MLLKKYSLLLLFSFLLIKIWAQTNQPPVVTGSLSVQDQYYCPQTQMNIVTNFNIVDPDDTGIEAVYVQISSGYVNGEDSLTLLGNHSNLTSSWSPSEGKLTIKSSTTGNALYTDLIVAVKNVVFKSNSSTPSDKSFSITIGDANYLPSTGHFYQYVADVGIPWTGAKIAAENRTYFGLQGYLATISSDDEAKLCGEQAAGAGWIGGSDSETEGVWKWVTGPETGKSFWIGAVSGTTSGTDIPYANWNTNPSTPEPNNLGNEDYAHITDKSVGIPIGSWNDLTNTGGSSGAYQPKGYIVEYGGMPNDPTLNISASTTIKMLKITNSSGDNTCGSGSFNLSATANYGDVLWFDSLASSTPIFTGNSFTTPILSETTTYYVLASANGCSTGERTPVTATINQIPTITNTEDAIVCGAGSKLISATASKGIINWYETATGGTSIHTGANFETPFITETTTYYVDVTSNGCTSSPRDAVRLTVEYQTFPIDVNINLDDFIIVDDSNNNSITINNVAGLGSGDYTFSLDNIDGTYQESPFFENVSAGLHIYYIKDNNSCGIDQIDVPVLGFPKFFTPNNDGVNDTWQLKGFNENFYPISSVSIFNRFGKILATIDAENEGWDGSFNGKTLSSGDYWFSVQLIDTNGVIREKQGHFSLIRK